MELTSRELASIILLAVFIGVLLAIPKTRRSIVPAIADVARAFFVPRILGVVFVYLAYTTLIVLVAYRLGFWNFDLLKDTFLVTFFVGFPIVMNAYKIQTGKALIGKVLRETIGISVLLAFYLNIEPLQLWGELILQPLIAVFALLGVVGRREEKTRRVGTFFNVLTGLIGLGLLIYTTAQIAQNWTTYDLTEIGSALALSIWLPVVLIPLVYVLAFYMHCESIFSRLPLHNDKKKPKIRVRLALLLGLHFSTRLASSFGGLWYRQIARAATFREAVRIMHAFRQSLRDEAEEELRRLARFREFAGVKGVDDAGLRLDRREFAETKTVLTDLFYMQTGWHRNRLGHFKDDMLNILGSVMKKGLPEDHGIQLRVRKDKQAWMAWRETPEGWYFGVGGTKYLNDQWQFDGPNPPGQYPSNGGESWTNGTRTPSSPEWAYSDKAVPASV